MLIYMVVQDHILRIVKGGEEQDIKKISKNGYKVKRFLEDKTSITLYESQESALNSIINHLPGDCLEVSIEETIRESIEQLLNYL